MASKIFVFLLINILFSVCKAAPSGDADVIKVPEECKINGLCSIKPEGYDQLEDKINSLLPENLIADSSDRAGTIDQHDDDPKGCPTVTSSQDMFLYTNGTDYDIIINTKRLYQKVTQVRCATDKYSPFEQYQCFKKLEFNPRINTVCVPSYTYIQLYVYVPSQRKIVKKSYSIPTCCSCQIQQNLDF